MTQDPRFGWGVRAQIDPFWGGATELGRRPELLYVRQPSLRRESPGPYRETGVNGIVGRFDAANQLIGGLRLAPLAATAGQRWVVSTTGSYGWAALRSGRPYGAWIGTALEDEWLVRRRWLPLSQRAALAANAPLLRRMERAVLRGATILCATSPASRAGLAQAAGIPESEIAVLPIPVDLESFTPLDESEWRNGLQEPTLAFVGRVDDPRKNVSLLLDAMPLLRRRFPAARAVLIGGYASQPLPDGVEAAGRVASVAQAIRHCALLIVPSRQEGFCVAAAEALASGVPVVSTPCGGPEELLGASGGGRVLTGFDADELADTTADLLEQPCKLAEMRRAGRAYVEHEHSPAVFRKRLAPFLRALETDC